MSRSLHMPKGRPHGIGGLWKLLFVLSGLTILALIWAERRARGQENHALGTAPAGAPPMRERNPAAPSVRANPLLERPGPYATPGTTSGAMAGAATAAAPDVAKQPGPIAEADAHRTASPERLATAGPDMAAWVGDLAGDTDGNGTPEETPVASAGTGKPAGGVATGEAATEDIPTPAADGKDWIQVNGEKTCPPEFPIKGNANSRIYHLPGESTYEATIPELCFANEEAAVRLGYRARKR